MGTPDGGFAILDIPGGPVPRPPSTAFPPAMWPPKIALVRDIAANHPDQVERVLHDAVSNRKTGLPPFQHWPNAMTVGLTTLYFDLLQDEGWLQGIMSFLGQLPSTLSDPTILLIACRLTAFRTLVQVIHPVLGLGGILSGETSEGEPSTEEELASPLEQELEALVRGTTTPPESAAPNLKSPDPFEGLKAGGQVD